MRRPLMRRLGRKTQRFGLGLRDAGIVIPAYVLLETLQLLDHAVNQDERCF